MVGGEGNDIYLFAVGDGNTQIQNYDASVGRYDVLRFASGISPNIKRIQDLTKKLIIKPDTEHIQYVVCLF